MKFGKTMKINCFIEEKCIKLSDKMSKSFINVYHAIWIYLRKPIRQANYSTDKIGPPKKCPVSKLYLENMFRFDKLLQYIPHRKPHRNLKCFAQPLKHTLSLYRRLWTAWHNWENTKKYFRYLKLLLRYQKKSWIEYRCKTDSETIKYERNCVHWSNIVITTHIHTWTQIDNLFRHSTFYENCIH